jgi:hypothetical protein
MLGGMPPVLVVRNEKNEANYYLVVGSSGEKMNEAMKDFVGMPVAINAKAVQYDDWIVLYVDPANGIQQYSYLQDHYKNSVLSCSTACSK